MGAGCSSNPRLERPSGEHKQKAAPKENPSSRYAVPEVAALAATDPSMFNVADVVGAMPPPLSRPLAADVKIWSFDIHKVAATDLPSLCFGAILQHPEVAEVLPPLSLQRLWAYTQEIASLYRDNTFHNYRHAVDVTLATSCLLRWAKEAHPGLLSDLQVVAMLVAAMVHDTDHPGVMNGFLVATRHELAVRYNDQSVNEQHHIATALGLLSSRPELDWMGPLPAAVQETLRQTMTDAIMQTDPAKHIPFMKQFAEDVAAKQVSAQQVITAILKAADISNPTRPLAVYGEWITAIMHEFFAQGDQEKALGLPVSMNCDRDTVNVDKCQVGFISFLVNPVWKGLAEFLPQVKGQLLPVLQSNLEHFQARAQTS